MTMPDVEQLLPERWSTLSHVGIVVHAADGSIQFANARALELLGLTADQMLGKSSIDPAWNVVHYDGSPFPGDQHPSSRALATGHSVKDVIMGVARPKRGDRVWLLVHAEPQPAPDGSVEQVIVTFTDISSIKRQDDASRAALRSADVFRRALDEVPVYVYLKDRDGRYSYANAPTLQLFGRRADELPGTHDSALFPPETVARLREVDLRVLAGEHTHETITVDGPDGSRRVYLEVKSPLEPARPGEPAPGLLGISVDITEREREKAQVARVSAFYAALARCYEAIALGVSEPLLFAEICRAAVEVGGVAMAWIGLEDPATRKVVPVTSYGDDLGYVDQLDITTDPDDPRGRGPTGTAIRTGETFWIDNFREDQRTGPWHAAAKASGWLQSAAVPIFRAGRAVGALTMYGRERDTFTPEVRQLLGDLARGIGIALDRLAETEARQHAERELRESHQRYRSLVDEMNSALMLVEVITDDHGVAVDHRHLLVNRVFTEITGIAAEDIVGKLGSEVDLGHDPATVRRAYEVARTGIPQQWDIFHPRFKRHLDTRAFSPAPGQVALAVTDTTERRALEEQLRQAQKMESIGRLAGGVAHDFNNMLSIILGRTELALGLVPAGSELHEDLEEVMNAGRRSAELTRQLLTFARKQPVAPRALNISEEIAKSLKLLRRLISEDIALSTELADDLWMTQLDPSQLDQILANLCVNARDAIRAAREKAAPGAPATHGVRISTRNVTLDGAFCAQHGGSPGDYVQLSVRDTGCGMDRELQQRIFEPFFTTKAAGEGTGLGLAMVFGAVQQSHGLITVTSEPGAGATFEVYLPRRTADAAPVAPTLAPAIQGKGETVLVVEDDHAVLQLAVRTLRQLGYTVLDANGPEEALQLEAKHAGTIDVLLSDIIMPKMNGVELSQQIVARRPGIKRLFMSGYTAEVLAEAHSGADEVPLLRKPFTRSELAAALRGVLAG